MAGLIEGVCACFDAVVTMVPGSTGRLIPQWPATFQTTGAVDCKPKKYPDHRQKSVS